MIYKFWNYENFEFFFLFFLILWNMLVLKFYENFVIFFWNFWYIEIEIILKNVQFLAHLAIGHVSFCHG